MKISRLLWIAAAMLAVTSAAAQSNVRVRGTIAAIDGNVLIVKSRDGRDLKIQLADNLSVAIAKAIRFEEIKQGDYVGATTKPGPDGSAVAVEVHYLAPTTPEGQLAWDLQPGSTMTNANVGRSSGSRQARTHAFLQRRDAADSSRGCRAGAGRAGTRADLVVGEYVFIGAQAAADGALSAARAGQQGRRETAAVIFARYRASPLGRERRD
jgi:hypothetical protein